MYTAMDIACAIVNYSNEINQPISNLKLQKVLYFVQGYYMQKNGHAIFNDDFEAWPYGPVVLEVYEQFQQYGSNFIPTITEYEDFSFDEFDYVIKEYNDNIFEKQDLKFIKTVVKKLSKYTASNLVTITHAQDPWKNAIKNGNRSTISKESIMHYFDKRSRNG